MCANWNKEYNPEFLAQGLESIKQVDGSGTFKGFEAYAYESYVTVIHSSLIFSAPIPETERRLIVHQAIMAVGKRGELNAKAIIGEISRLENAYLKRSLEDFVLCTNLSVDYFGGINKTAAVLGCPIKFSSGLPKHFNRQTVVDGARDWIHGELPASYSYVRVLVQARSIDEAFATSLDALDLLRGIWNIFFNQRRIAVLSFHNIPKPINRILLGPLHTLHRPGGELASTGFWYEPDYVGPVKCFNLSEEWERLRRYEKQIRRSLTKSNYQSAMSDVLRRYARALDHRNFNEAFIALWGLLEHLTASTVHETVIRRTIFLYRDREFHQQILRHLKSYRNRTVHAGHATDQILILLYQLKRYVEYLLLFHIFNVHGFSSLNEAGEFLSQPVNKSDLENRIKLMRKALKFLK
jgi:hypothetical protein